MSDNLHVHGRLRFDPPLAWLAYRELLERPLPDGNDRSNSVLMIEEQVQTVHTDDGVLTRRTAIGVRPRHDYEHGKTRHLAAELRELKEVTVAAGSKLVGYLISDVGYIGGVHRWSIDKTNSGYTDERYNWEVRREAALLVWPDGSSAVKRQEEDDRFWEYTGDGESVFPCAGDATLQPRPREWSD